MALNHIRLWLCAAVALAACAAPEAPVAPSPRDVGARAADAVMRRETFMTYEVGDVVAPHYAEAAAAYGAARFAAATGDAALMDAVRDRYERLLAQDIPNTADHVDANVVGVWPLALYIAAGDEAYLAQGLALADGQWETVGPDGLTAQARYWIDDVWMIGLLQVQAWRATGDAAYLDRAARTAQAYVERLQQPDGLFHHGPDAPFYWARGDGWVAAGLAETLSELPADHPAYAALTQSYRAMMDALVQHQADDGMWRQLIDHEDAWSETSGTAMFGFALATGLAHGLLDDAVYAEAVARAWAGLAAYVGDDGRVADVCVGTGQSDDVDYYLSRPTVVGDLHGQAPVLWFAAVLIEAETRSASDR